ncbi:MAG: hypothetical protein AB7I18_09010 [Candidatus Berkiella sp.]
MLANRHLIFIVFLLFCTLSCSTKQSVIHEAQQNGFIQNRYSTPTFLLTTYERVTASHPICHVYIEGDGNSWKTKHQLSNNPTPKQPLALQLACHDQHPQVIYIARPCQYTPLALDSSCDPKYWSSHRYAKEVVQAFHATLDQISAKHGTDFLLIGFSGGASIAALIASDRKDIVGLITVAGDLNHIALNRYHHTTPLTGSLNPMDVASKLKNLPQKHWSGGKDKTVPIFIASQFSKAVNNPSCCHIEILPEAEHHAGWVKKWSEMIQQPLECVG